MSPEREALQKTIERVKALADEIASADPSSASQPISIDLEALSASLEIAKPNRIPRHALVRGLETRTTMATINSVGSSPITEPTFPSSSSAPSMSTDELMTWLRSRMDQMGGEVAQGTRGVDDRQKAIDDLVQAKGLKSPQDNGKIVSLYQDALSKLPPDSPQAQQITSWIGQYGGADAQKAAADTQAKAFNVLNRFDPGDPFDSKKVSDLMALGLSQTDAKSLVAAYGINKNASPELAEKTLKMSFPDATPPTVDRTAENDGIDQIKSDFTEQNQQETVLLQQSMNRAQEALTEMSSIFKGMHDMAMDTIHKIA